MGEAAEKLIEERIAKADGKIILNLGCGDKLWSGAINCDIETNYSGKRPDVVCDISKRLPFDDDYADEVHAIHVLEHFYFPEVEGVLREWTRVLKPGGWLCIEVPCLEKIMNNFRNKELAKTDNYIPLTWLGLYGDQVPEHPEMLHKWCYSSALLVRIFEVQGYKNIQALEPLFHVRARDMRVIGQK